MRHQIPITPSTVALLHGRGPDLFMGHEQAEVGTQQ